jgi:hypothetical protein
MSVRPTSFLCTNSSCSLTNGNIKNSPIEHIQTPPEEHTYLLQSVKQLSKGNAILVMVTFTSIGSRCKQDMMLWFVGFHHSSTQRLNYKQTQLKESSNTDLSICHLKDNLSWPFSWWCTASSKVTTNGQGLESNARRNKGVESAFRYLSKFWCWWHTKLRS